MNKTIMYGLMFLSLAAIAMGALTDDIQAYWTFDNADTSGSTASDKLGNIDMTIVGAVTGQSCKINECYQYNGSTDYLTAVHSSYHELYSHYTITAWIKADSYPAFSGTDQNYIVHKGDSDFDNGNYGYRSDGDQKLSSKIRKDGSSKISQGTTVMKAGEWYFVATIFNGSHVKTYLNATLEGTPAAVTSPLNSNTDNLFIGSANTNGWEYRWNGTIDEVGIWNRSLSDAELTELFNSGSGLSYPFSDCAAPSSGTWNIPDGCSVEFTDMIAHMSKGYDILWSNILVNT